MTLALTPLLLGLGPQELIIILIILLLLFGGSRLAGLGKSSGRALKEFKEETKGLREEGKPNPDPAAGAHAVLPPQQVTDAQPGATSPYEAAPYQQAPQQPYQPAPQQPYQQAPQPYQQAPQQPYQQAPQPYQPQPYQPAPQPHQQAPQQPYSPTPNNLADPAAAERKDV